MQKLNEIINILKSGGIGVLPTDTIYGIVGSALNPETVEKIYDLRKRAKDKPMIILISDIEDLKKFGIKINEKTESFLNKIWPNSISVILPCNNEEFKYLHRGKNSLAFRFPKNQKLLELLKQTGPLVAPSANFEGEPPALNVEDAKKYFKDDVDFYCDKQELAHEDAGELKSSPSTLIEIKDNKINILRQGEIKITDEQTGLVK